MQETCIQSLGQGDPLEKERFLPGKFHSQRSLVGYSPRGCKRVGHDLATKQQCNVLYKNLFLIQNDFPNLQM